MWLIHKDKQMVVYLWKDNTENTGKNKCIMENTSDFPSHFYKSFKLNLLIVCIKKKKTLDD